MKHERSFMVFSLITGLLMLSAMFVPVSVSKAPVDEVKGTPAGWSDEINLSNDPTYRDIIPEIAVNKSNIYIVWLHNYNEVYYSKSINGGEIWSNPISLYSSASNVLYPIIREDNNSIHVAWSSAYKIFYSNSTDNGDTWSSIQIISNESTALADYSRLFVNGDNIHVSWYDVQDGSDGEVYYRRSLDGGITWDDGQGVDQDRRITYSPSVVTKPLIAGYRENISVAWMDERNGDFEIYWMISKDNGYTWEDGLGNIGLDRRLTYTGVYDYAITVNGFNIHIAWLKQTWPGPTYSLYYCNSTDNGITWNTPKLLSGPVSSMAGPDITVDRSNVSIVWSDRRDDGTHGQIYCKNSTNGGITWNPDLRLTYNLSRESAAPKIRIDNGTTHLARADRFPSNDREIYYKRYPDFPDLTPPSHSNETPPPESYRDAPGTNISVHVTDPSGVNDTTIQLYVNGSLVTHTSTPITDGFNVSYISPGFDPGVVECRIIADDNCSNTLDYTWNFTVLALYEIQLQEGWNLISVPHVQVDTAINEVLRDIDGKWNYIQRHDASDPSNHWKTNATFKPQQLNDLCYLNRSMAFWINITEPNVNLTVRGHISTYTEIPLYAGWNLVGYPTLYDTETVGNAFFGTGANRVEVFDPGEPYRIKEVGPTYVMKPGEGYWVHVPTNSVWKIDW